MHILVTLVLFLLLFFLLYYKRNRCSRLVARSLGQSISAWLPPLPNDDQLPHLLAWWRGETESVKGSCFKELLGHRRMWWHFSIKDTFYQQNINIQCVGLGAHSFPLGGQVNTRAPAPSAFPSLHTLLVLLTTPPGLLFMRHVSCLPWKIVPLSFL